MPIVSVILALIIIGVALYLVETFLPMDAAIKTAIRVLVLLLVLVWLVELLFGGLDIGFPHGFVHRPC